MISLKVENQFAFSDKNRNIEVYINREDLIHSFVSGNKFRKLKYNLAEAKKENYKCLIVNI